MTRARSHFCSKRGNNPFTNTQVFQVISLRTSLQHRLPGRRARRSQRTFHWRLYLPAKTPTRFITRPNSCSSSHTILVNIVEMIRIISLSVSHRLYGLYKRGANLPRVFFFLHSGFWFSFDSSELYSFRIPLVLCFFRCSYSWIILSLRCSLPFLFLLFFFSFRFFFDWLMGVARSVVALLSRFFAHFSYLAFSFSQGFCISDGSFGGVRSY
jgi:hypothetical protein